jgi:hypothetical protein
MTVPTPVGQRECPSTIGTAWDSARVGHALIAAVLRQLTVPSVVGQRGTLPVCVLSQHTPSLRRVCVGHRGTGTPV